MRTSVLLALAAGLLPWLACDIGSDARRPSKPKTLPLPHDAPLALAPLARPSLALAPDGAVLVYVAARDGGTQLYEYPLDGSPGRPIPGTEGATHPFHSHDGRWLGFVTERELKKFSVGDGRIVTLHEVSDPVGASFGTLGEIVFAHDMGKLLSLISAEGDEHRVVASRETYFWPYVLPGSDSCVGCRERREGSRSFRYGLVPRDKS